MRRVAIFVEGQAELIFVREFLLKWHSYDVDLECRALRGGNVPHPVDYDYPNNFAPLHFQLISVGTDVAVLSQILRHEQRLYNAGYESIVGLRDMFSEDYIKIVKNRSVNQTENENFYSGALATIQAKAFQATKIKLCFAIMELEAWWIGIPSLWKGIDNTIKKQHQTSFEEPESIFHPAVFVDQLFQAQQSTYKKKKGEVESIVGRISREDYVELLGSQRCPSFCEFVQHLHLQ